MKTVRVKALFTEIDGQCVVKCFFFENNINISPSKFILKRIVINFNVNFRFCRVYINLNEAFFCCLIVLFYKYKFRMRHCLVLSFRVIFIYILNTFVIRYT